MTLPILQNTPNKIPNSPFFYLTASLIRETFNIKNRKLFSVLSPPFSEFHKVFELFSKLFPFFKLLLGASIGHFFCPSVGRSVHQSVSRLVCWLISQLFSQSVGWLSSLSVEKSLNNFYGTYEGDFWHAE